MKILIVDDDPAFNKMLGSYLERKKYTVFSAYSANSAIELLEENEVDLVLTDFRLPDCDGLELIAILKKKLPQIPVILITNYSDIRTAVDSIKLGAFEFVSKPIIPEELLATMDMALKEKNGALKKAPVQGEKKGNGRTVHGDFVEGTTVESVQLWEHVSIVAPTNLSVIIFGESGTGKENVARTIHARSRRSSEPFVAIDCGSLSKDLAASELFGHKKGAFTGALSDKKGQFELANGGTVFLDEVGNLPYEVQIKLLRALQERKIRPLGGDGEIEVDVRIISATNETLDDQDAFRTDLYHRLNEFEISLPPLRERLHDLDLYCGFFVEKAAGELSKQPVELDHEVIEVFRNYDWPGNLRELKNIIRRAVLLNTEDRIDLKHLPNGFGSRKSSHGENVAGVPATLNIREDNAVREKALIKKALVEFKYNKSATAKALNIDRSTLYRKLKDYGIDS